MSNIGYETARSKVQTQAWYFPVMPSDANNSPSESESSRAVASAASESENKCSKYQLTKLKQFEGCSG